jgi:hypothetical protein
MNYDTDLDILEEDASEDQQENSKVPKHLLPHLFKKGQSGNPAGRPPGKSLKEYTRAMLAAMTDEERQKFLHGIPKEKIWEMAEGKADTRTTIDGKIEQTINNISTLSDDELIRIATGSTTGTGEAGTSEATSS